MIDNDRVKTYVGITRIVISLCWASLFTFWSMKLFGYNAFEVVVNNHNFIAFSRKVQTTDLKYLVSYITNFATNYLLIGAVCQKFTFKKWHCLPLILAISSMWVIVNFVPDFFHIHFWYGYAVIIGYGIVYQRGWKRLFGVLACALEVLFTTISLLIRDIRLQVLDDYLITLILLIDTFIMIVLYYLYSNLFRLKKEIE